MALCSVGLGCTGVAQVGLGEAAMYPTSDLAQPRQIGLQIITDSECGGQQRPEGNRTTTVGYHHRAVANPPTAVGSPPAAVAYEANVQNPHSPSTRGTLQS